MNPFKEAICEYEQTVGEVLTCSPPFLSYHDQVSQSAPQSGIDPKEYSIAWMDSQNRKKVSHVLSVIYMSLNANDILSVRFISALLPATPHTLPTDQYTYSFGNLHRLPEVSNRHSHGAVFVDVPKEIPQS